MNGGNSKQDCFKHLFWCVDVHKKNLKHFSVKEVSEPPVKKVVCLQLFGGFGFTVQNDFMRFESIDCFDV